MRMTCMYDVAHKHVIYRTLTAVKIGAPKVKGVIDGSLKKYCIGFQDQQKLSRLARMFNIPRTTHGSVENRPRTGRRKEFTHRDEVQIERLVKTERKSTLNEITHKFNEEKKDQTGRFGVAQYIWNSELYPYEYS